MGRAGLEPASCKTLTRPEIVGFYIPKELTTHQNELEKKCALPFELPPRICEDYWFVRGRRVILLMPLAVQAVPGAANYEPSVLFFKAVPVPPN